MKNYNLGPNSSVLYRPQDPQVLLTFNYHLPEPTQPKARTVLHSLPSTMPYVTGENVYLWTSACTHNQIQQKVQVELIHSSFRCETARTKSMLHVDRVHYIYLWCDHTPIHNT